MGSADFTESQLIASIYSQALQAAGVSVKEQFNIGSREVYIAALKDGSIDLVPEYSGALLSYLDPKSTAATTEAVTTELKSKLPSGISMLTPSAAEDKDVVAVTKATADKYKLKTVSDLKPVAGELVLGGPPEWKTRTQGVVGLRDVYGLNFKDFVSLDAGGTLTMTALTNGQIQAGDLFSTDPGLVTNNLVALEDDKNVVRRGERGSADQVGQAERHHHQDTQCRVGEAHHRRPDLDECRGREGHQPVRYRQEVARQRRHRQGLR